MLLDEIFEASFIKKKMIWSRRGDTVQRREIVIKESETSTEISDLSFNEGISKLLGIKDDQVQELISKLDIDTLNELANAVSNNDKRAALAIFYATKNINNPNKEQPKL